ncbi:MAG: hypothetical protein ACHP7C_04450, partial [Lysobacterales bacterium]
MSRWRVALFLPLLAFGFIAQAIESPQVLDDFSHPATWQASGTDDISASLRAADGRSGKALCLDFNFNGASGGATLRRTLPISFPANYALSF